MTLLLTMKDGTRKAYDGVIKIEERGHYAIALHVYYYTPSSAIAKAEINMADVDFGQINV